MSITDNKITRWNNPIANEADRPQRSAYDMKRVFDSNSNQLKSALNNLIDELSEQGASNIGINLDGSESDNVQDVIQDIHAAVRENAHNIDEIGEMNNQLQSDVRDLEDDVEHLLETTENVAYKEDLESYALKSELENLPGAKNLLDGSFTGSLRTKGARAEDDEYSIGQHAMAIGRDTQAVGHGSFAEGRYSVAEGEDSHAEGYHSKAVGKGSHAEGYYTTASGEYQHVQGKNNVEDTEGRYAHIVGNGPFISARRNIHTLDWDGVGWFKGGLKVGGTSQDDGEEIALKSDLEGLGGGGVSDNDILAALIETDSLPAITTTAGAILTDTNGNIIIRY